MCRIINVNDVTLSFTIHLHVYICTYVCVLSNFHAHPVGVFRTCRAMNTSTVDGRNPAPPWMCKTM